MKYKELRGLSLEELQQKRIDLKEELLNLRVQASSRKLDNPLRIRMVRRMIASINTILRGNESRKEK
ncbi:MAG: 50S ribosomal protein L29 [bacterium]|nr:50S ribosomal protein L29 [bacterium]